MAPTLFLPVTLPLGRLPRALLVLAVLLGSLLGLDLAAGSAASASPPASAAQRCSLHAVPDMTQTVTYAGSQVGASFPSEANPPNAVFPGDVVHVTITGSVRVNLRGTVYGPGGNGVTRSLVRVSLPGPARVRPRSPTGTTTPVAG